MNQTFEDVVCVDALFRSQEGTVPLTLAVEQMTVVVVGRLRGLVRVEHSQSTLYTWLDVL